MPFRPTAYAMLMALVILWGLLALVLIASTAFAAGRGMPNFRDAGQEQAQIPTTSSPPSAGNESGREEKASAGPEMNPGQAA